MTDAQRGDFGRPAPVSGARERLAEALTDDVLVPIERGPVLDALLPVVESLADERAAEALDEVADWVWEQDKPWAEVWHALRDRAVSLRASSREETGR